MVVVFRCMQCAPSIHSESLLHGLRRARNEIHQFIICEMLEYFYHDRQSVQMSFHEKYEKCVCNFFVF